MESAYEIADPEDAGREAKVVLFDPSTLPERPRPEQLWRPKIKLVSDIRELWADHELIRSIAERNLRNRYSQSLLGVVWSVLTPLGQILIFTLVFKKIGRLRTGPAPYALQTYLGLLPWGFFASAVTSMSASLISNSTLLNKMTCAREVFPIAELGTSLFDMILATVPLGVLFIYYGYPPSVDSYWVIPLFGLQLMLTLGVGMAMSTVTIYFRDLKMILGSVIAVGMYLSPVVYPVQSMLDRFPPPLRPVYSAINPFVGLIQGYRNAVLYGVSPPVHVILPSTITCVVAFFVGYWVFRRYEPGVVDIA